MNMIRLRYIIRSGSLVLRISERKDRYYKNVMHMLVGSPDLKYWDVTRERFGYRCSKHIENNEILDRFKSLYRNLTTEHPTLSAHQIASFYRRHTNPLNTYGINAHITSVEEYIKVIIEREKSKPGDNYTFYYKLLQKCRKVIPDFANMSFQSIDFDSCLRIANIFAKYRNYTGTSKSFRALLGKADVDSNVEFSLSQIGGFKFQDYNPDKYNEGIQIPDVLNPEDLRSFLNLDVNNLTQSYKDRFQVNLYYDFCRLMFYTFLAPCDAIRIENRNISKRKTLILRRKKTCKLVEIPIHPIVGEIISKYRNSKSNYILPILSRKSSKDYKTQNYLYIRFRERLNIWLKAVGAELALDFDLHSYTFRHTAITTALNGGLPLSYVAQLTGTTPENIQRYYYNGSTPDNQNLFQHIFTNAGSV